MGMTDFFHRNAARLQWTALVLQCALISFVSIAYALSTPHPDVRAQLGSVDIDLAKLDYKLTFADLQSAGMLMNISCRKCNFSAKGEAPHLEDFKDVRFMGTLFKHGRYLSLGFYGTDIAAGQQRFDAALQALHAKFPALEGAIIRKTRGYDDILRQEAEVRRAL